MPAVPAPAAPPAPPAALPVEPVRTAPAYQQVAEQLRGLILSGEVEPGDRLPSESDLAEQFGVSRSTVREALRVLSSQHLVATRRGVTGGTHVAVPEPDLVRGFLESSIGMLSLAEVVSVRDLLDVRIDLEVPAARRAAERAGADDLRAIEATLVAPRGRDRAAVYGDNEGFHLAVLHATGNPLLEIVTCPLWGVLRARFLRDGAPRGFWNRVHAEHARIHAAIADHDGDAAAGEMRAHLERLAGAYERMERGRR